jgi:hypothetical protein
LHKGGFLPGIKELAEKLALASILLVLFITYILDSQEQKRKDESRHISAKEKKVPQKREYGSKKGEIYTDRNIHDYIVYVIDHGSNGLGFPGGEMEGGYIDPSDSDMLACYVPKSRNRNSQPPEIIKIYHHNSTSCQKAVSTSMNMP